MTAEDAAKIVDEAYVYGYAYAGDPACHAMFRDGEYTVWVGLDDEREAKNREEAISLIVNWDKKGN